MKKTIFVILAAIFAFTLISGCEKNISASSEKTESRKTSQSVKSSPALAGGFQDAENGEITDELKGIFDKAFESEKDAPYVPVRLLATQVVAGLNYRFECKNSAEETFVITIYKDLSGNCSVLSIYDSSGEKIEKQTDSAKD